MQRTNSEYGSPYLATHHFPSLNACQCTSTIFQRQQNYEITYKHVLFKCIKKHLKGSYDAILKIIILCIWCNRICWHALMFRNHIIFQILYIIVGPLCPASLKRFVFYKAPPSAFSTVCSDWPADPEHCDWPNTTSSRQKCNVPYHNRELQLSK